MMPTMTNVTYTATSQTGTIVDNNDGTFTYTPTGPTDTLTFRGDDGHGGITTKTINIAPNYVPTGSAVGEFDESGHGA